MNRYRPNGALLFAINFILENIDWLLERIAKFPGHYLIFDFPGIDDLKDLICSYTSNWKDKSNSI